MVLSNSSEVTSSSDGGTGAMPALFTSTSMRPNSATVGVDERTALVPVAHVAAHREGAATERAHLVGDLLARRELAARDHDVGAGLREAERHRPAEALAPAGDDDHLAGGVEGRDGHGTITSLPTTPRSAMRCSAWGRSSNDTWSVTALRSRPSRDERGEVRVDVVELGARVAAGEHADQRPVRDHEVVGREHRPAATGEPDREQPSVTGQRTGGVLGDRAADRVVDQVDTAAVGELPEPGRDRAVAVVQRGVGTEPAAERRLLVVAHHRDDARAEGLAELHRGDATAAGGAEHDQFVALRDPTAVDEADPPGEVRDPEARRPRRR